MFVRFIRKDLTLNRNHNVFRIQESSIKFISLLQTLALNPNSNTCNPTNQHNPTVSYLINKCGLSLDSAISASKELSIKSTQKPDSVLQLFNSYGFTQTQITNLITKCPSLIKFDPHKTLKPKFEYFESLGLSKPQVAKIVSSDKAFLHSSLKTRITPTVDFLKTVLNTDEALVYTLKRWPTIMFCNYRVQMEPNLLTLRAHGADDVDIRKLLMMQPRAFIIRHELFEDRVRRVEELGISPKSLAYFRCIRILLSMRKSLWEKKVNIFKSFGWSDGDILEAFRKQPNFMSVSEKKIRIMMYFYLNKLGLKTSDVARYPILLMSSLEKRMIPRCLVLQVLLSKGFTSELSLLSALTVSTAHFERTFVTKYQEVVPDIVSVYQGENGFIRSEAVRLMPPLGLCQARRTILKRVEQGQVLKVVSSNDL